MKKLIYITTLLLSSCTTIPEIKSVNAVKQGECIIMMIVEYKDHDQTLQLIVPSELICDESKWTRTVY